MGSNEIVDSLLILDSELRATYMYYRDLLDAYLTAIPPMLSEEIKTSIRTLKKHKERIRNAFAPPIQMGLWEALSIKSRLANRLPLLSKFC